MEKEKNYTPIIITFGIIVFIALVGVYYIGKSSNNSPFENSQTQENQTPIDTSVQTPPAEPAQTKVQAPPLVKTQTPPATNYDLAENPNYLFSKNFDPNKVKYYGVGIGDPVSSINPSSIKHQQEYLPGLVRLLNGDAYMTSNGVITGMYLGSSTIDSSLFGIYTRNDIFTKFGWPDRTVTTSDYYVGTNHNTATEYSYISRELKVTENVISGQTFITVNINWN